MNLKIILYAFTVSLVICILANAEAVSRQSTSEDPESLRRMLANQPDYTAVQRHFFLTEGSGGVMDLGNKVAKLGDKLAEVTESTVLIYEPGKPTIKVFRKRKEYATMPAERRDHFAMPPANLVNPEEVAKRSDVVFKSVGTEKVGKYTCVKIEVSHKDERLKGVKLLFWVASELKNLVIQLATSSGGVSYLTQLEDISFVVNEELFGVPAGYKKVADPKQPTGRHSDRPLSSSQPWEIFHPENFY